MADQKPLKIIVRNATQLGHAIRRFRKLDDRTQATLGRESGIKQAIVSTVERGASRTRLETIFRLLAALNLEVIVRRRPTNREGFNPEVLF